MKPIQYLSVSTLTTIARCPRKAFYTRSLELFPSNDAPALRYGEAIHNGIPELTKEGNFTDEQRLQSALARFTKIWDSSLSDDKRNFERAVFVFQDFLHAHSGPFKPYRLLHPRSLPYTTDANITSSDTVSEYEIPFIIDIGLSVPLVGRIDGLCQLSDGTFSLLEYKTASNTWNYFDAFALSPQVLLYTLAARTIFPTLNIKSTMVEVLEVSKTKTNTISQTILVQDHQLEEIRKWALIVGQLYLDCEKRNDFPKFFSGCHPYASYGSHGYLCEYEPLCSNASYEQLTPMYVKRPDRRYEVFFPSGEKGIFSQGID